MNEQQFWDIIQRSLVAQNVEEQIDFLDNELNKLSKEEILEFDYIFRQKHEDAFTWDIWAAAYTIQGGCSDDGFMDFRGWLVYRGKEVFEKALKNSDSLAELGKEKLEESEESEDFYYLTADAYEEITGVEGLDVEEDPNFKPVEFKDEPSGQDWDEDNLEQLKQRNPEVFKLFWK
jgi:uncharacterized protein DUF4240